MQDMHIPKMLTGDELKQALTHLPSYDEDIRKASQAERLVALNALYDIYYPSFMASEIYSKLYLAFVRALQKKQSIAATRQAYENKKATRSQIYQSIIGGSDSFSIIGVSGIGKSSAISRSISLISNDCILEMGNTTVIPFLTIQTPCDSSLKGLLLEILRSVDAVLDTRHYADAIRARATLDMLIGSVSQVCLNHICVLIIDEAQNVITSKNGKNLVNALVQLINNSSISLCFVGTPECNTFFESAFQIARRSIGLYYSSLSYDEYFRTLCEIVFRYQYTQQLTAITEEIISWLYLHSGGITALVISLIQSAQELAILDGTERLCIGTLNEAFKRRLNTMRSFIEINSHTVSTQARKTNSAHLTASNDVVSLEDITLTNLVSSARNSGLDIVTFLKQHITIEEIQL